MYYPLYKAIKDRLVTELPDLKDVQWFNNQYAGVIHAEPIALIEFPSPVPVLEISKQTSRATIDVCVHIISKSMSDTDKSITDAQVKAHDDLGDAAVVALNNFAPVYDSLSAGSKLIYSGFESDHSYIGWLVTKLSFTTKILG
jgi:hypothetical protein